MKFHLISVRDQKLESYGRPFCAPHINAAVRGFTEEVNNPQSDLFKYTSDFDLYELGEFDDCDASFNLLKVPRLVVSGVAVKRPDKDAA